MKKKMDTFTKAKLIYSGELLVFAIAFSVVAILEFVKVIKISERHHLIFNWITIFGGTWLIVDFLWALLSKKRRKKVSLLDKSIHMPLGIYLVTFDLIALITKPDDAIFQICIPVAISYLCICYYFEAIYHFFYPIPGLLDFKDIEEKAEAEAEENSEENVEEAIEEDNPEEKNEE